MMEVRSDHSAAHVRERGLELLEEAAEQSRPRIVAERLTANARWFVQAALATALAWAAATALFGHPRPIFAPVTALIAVSTTLGQRRRYAVEMVIGTAVGVGVADALFVLIGGGTLQIAAIVAGAMVAALPARGPWSPTRLRRLSPRAARRCRWRRSRVPRACTSPATSVLRPRSTC